MTINESWRQPLFGIEPLQYNLRMGGFCPIATARDMPPCNDRAARRLIHSRDATARGAGAAGGPSLRLCA